MMVTRWLLSSVFSEHSDVGRGRRGGLSPPGCRRAPAWTGVNRWEFAENSPRRARCERGAQASPESALKAVFALTVHFLLAARRGVQRLRSYEFGYH